MQLSEYRRLEWLTVAVAALVGLVPVVFGFDYCDTGFYMTFYDNFFSSASSVEHNMMYWLSGLVGGSWLALFPWVGIVGVRVLGLLVSLVTIVILFRIYRGVVSPWATAAGSLMIQMACLQCPMAFYNDTLTALLLVAGVGMLVRGLLGDDRRLIVGAGLVLGVNVFARTPNVLDIFLVVLIPVHAWLFRRHDGMWRRVVSFVVGFVAGMALIVALMAALGQLDLYTYNLSQLMTSASADPSVGSAHGFGALVKVQLTSYLEIFRLMLKLLGLAVLVGLTAYKIKWRVVRWALYAVWSVWGIEIFVRTLPVMTVAAIVLPSLLIIVFKYPSKRLRLWGWAALLVALIFPLGSDGAMKNNGSIVYWLAAPLAVELIEYFVSACIGTRRALTVIGVVLAMFSGAMTFNLVRTGTYFDGKPLWQMTATIDSPCAAGVLTTPSRAATVNSMIHAVRDNVAPGDTLLAYGSIPMINYLTGTRPAMGCSWPELLTTAQLQERLGAMTGRPAILVQKFATIGSEYHDPTPGFVAGMGEGVNTFHNAAKSDIINGYIGANGYVAAVDTPWFTLYCQPRR